MDVAKEADLELWERQPGETDWEYTVWMHYRDQYPGKKPSYRDVAEALGTSVAAVRKISSRWSFVARMQAWSKHVDDITLAERRDQIKRMNETHVRLAEKISLKLEKAIDNLDPVGMTAKEINGLFKTMAEVERKARLDQSAAAQGVADDNTPEVKKTTTPTDQLEDVVAILAKTGVLQNIGVRQTTTTTTEVVIQE